MWKDCFIGLDHCFSYKKTIYREIKTNYNDFPYILLWNLTKWKPEIGSANSSHERVKCYSTFDNYVIKYGAIFFKRIKISFDYDLPFNENDRSRVRKPYW